VHNTALVINAVEEDAIRNRDSAGSAAVIISSLIGTDQFGRENADAN
jgi:hypothetical protein